MQGRNRNNFVTIAGFVVVLGAAALLSPLVWSVCCTLLQARERGTVDRSSSGNQGSGNASMRLVIPKLGLDAIVVDEVTESDLNRGPMHLAGTALPGRPGNCCIAAHKEKWFRRLGHLKMGDVAMIYAFGAWHSYTITGSQVVRASDASVLSGTREPMLTLITCTGRPYFGSGSGRLIVTASLQNSR